MTSHNTDSKQTHNTKQNSTQQTKHRHKTQTKNRQKTQSKNRHTTCAINEQRTVICSPFHTNNEQAMISYPLECPRSHIQWKGKVSASARYFPALLLLLHKYYQFFHDSLLQEQQVLTQPKKSLVSSSACGPGWCCSPLEARWGSALAARLLRRS